MHVRQNAWVRRRQAARLSQRFYSALIASARTLWAIAGAYLVYRGVRSVNRHLHVVAERQTKEANLDRTLADSFPASDPPSTIPDPGSRPD